MNRPLLVLLFLGVFFTITAGVPRPSAEDAEGDKDYCITETNERIPVGTHFDIPGVCRPYYCAEGGRISWNGVCDWPGNPPGCHIESRSDEPWPRCCPHLVCTEVVTPRRPQ